MCRWGLVGGGGGWWVLFGQPHTQATHKKCTRHLCVEVAWASGTRRKKISNTRAFCVSNTHALPPTPHAPSPAHTPSHPPMRRTPSSRCLRQSAGRPPLPNRAHASAAQRTNVSHQNFAPAGAVERHPLAASALAPFMFDLEVSVWPPGRRARVCGAGFGVVMARNGHGCCVRATLPVFTPPTLATHYPRPPPGTPSAPALGPPAYECAPRWAAGGPGGGLGRSPRGVPRTFGARSCSRAAQEVPLLYLLPSCSHNLLCRHPSPRD